MNNRYTGSTSNAVANLCEDWANVVEKLGCQVEWPADSQPASNLRAAFEVIEQRREILDRISFARQAVLDGPGSGLVNGPAHDHAYAIGWQQYGLHFSDLRPCAQVVVLREAANLARVGILRSPWNEAA